MKTEIKPKLPVSKVHYLKWLKQKLLNYVRFKSFLSEKRKEK
jgi:hypothetical protein